LLEPFPPKPKEMRPALWLKLFSKCQKYEQKSLLSAPAAIAELSARLVPALKVRRKKQQVETRTRNGAKLWLAMPFAGAGEFTRAFFRTGR